LIERIRCKWLAQQQRPPALHGQIDWRERTRLAARLDERRAAAVNNVNRPAPYSAASGGGRTGSSFGGANVTGLICSAG
jgi:hypothetical protein